MEIYYNLTSSSSVIKRIVVHLYVHGLLWKQSHYTKEKVVQYMDVSWTAPKLLIPLDKVYYLENY